MMTETAIETDPRPTWPPDPIYRLDAENIAALRKSSAGRWLARLSRFGEQVWCQHDTPFGHPGPLIVQLLPAAGPSLAASSAGVFVNYARRESDGMRCGYRPEGRPLKKPDLNVACGVVERAWVDRFGVVGIIALWSPQVQEDLRMLNARDALVAAQICLCFSADFSITRGPWQLPIVDVVGGRAFSLEFTALTHAPGSRVVRSLARDEEPDEAEIIPSDTRVLPPRWSGLPAEEPDGAVTTADLTGGAVTTPIVDPSAISNVDATSVASHTTAGAGEEVIATITVPGAGGFVTIEAKLACNLSGAVGNTHTYRIRKGSTTAGTQLDFTTATLAGNDTWFGSVALLAYDPTPGTSQSYVITAQDSAGAHTVQYVTMKGERYKR